MGHSGQLCFGGKWCIKYVFILLTLYGNYFGNRSVFSLSVFSYVSNEGSWLLHFSWEMMCFFCFFPECSWAGL